VDLTKVTVDDIFRAKEERRQRLARLPFEQKIAIVKKLQTIPAALKDERNIFASFLRAYPDLAGEPIDEWDVVEDWYAKRGLAPPPHPFDKRPDIIAVTASGRRIGVELKSWVDRDQIAEARRQERIQDTILKALGEQPPNESQHIGYIWLSARQVRFDQRDAAQFRQQMFTLIEQVDNAWPQKPDWDQDLFENVHDLTAFPILEKYLHSVEFHRRPRFTSGWIQFPSRGGAYSPNDMLGTLSTSLIAHKNDERYKDLKQRAGLDEVYLLVHYDFKAFAYNTPFDAPGFGFKEAADLASKELCGDGGYFDRIFLFHFLWSQEEAYRIFPGPVSQGQVDSESSSLA